MCCIVIVPTWQPLSTWMLFNTNISLNPSHMFCLPACTTLNYSHVKQINTVKITLLRVSFWHWQLIWNDIHIVYRLSNFHILCDLITFTTFSKRHLQLWNARTRKCYRSRPAANLKNSLKVHDKSSLDHFNSQYIFYWYNRASNPYALCLLMECLFGLKRYPVECSWKQIKFLFTFTKSHCVYP